MIISFSTANLYYTPFDVSLDIIKEAGFNYIEIADYWKGGDNWETAQHLKHYSAEDVIALTAEKGLSISSYHDMGGCVVPEYEYYISTRTNSFLEKFCPMCVVLHAPHYRIGEEKEFEERLESIKTEIQNLKKYTNIICIENMQNESGWVNPLENENELKNFAQSVNAYITFDVCHCYNNGHNIYNTLNILSSTVKTIHLSDCSAYNNYHACLGEGDIDISRLLSLCVNKSIYQITIECAVNKEPVCYMIECVKKQRRYIENILNKLGLEYSI